jgi:hypothetical protein
MLGVVDEAATTHIRAIMIFASFSPPSMPRSGHLLPANPVAKNRIPLGEKGKKAQKDKCGDVSSPVRIHDIATSGVAAACLLLCSQLFT